MCVFPDYFSFMFFDLFLLHLDIKTKFIKFYTEFWVKRDKFLPRKCTSWLLCSKPVHQHYFHFFKTFKTLRALRVNETKFNLRNAFNLDLFSLRGKKE